MKQLIFFLVLILSFSRCSEFHHLHYRHVKKVPANGFAEKFSGKERSGSAEEKPAVKIDSSRSIEVEISNEKQDSVIPAKDDNPVYDLPAILKKQTGNSAAPKKVFREKSKLKKPVVHRKRGDGSVFLIVLFLFFGVCLMVIGGSLFVAAFYGFSVWMLLLGLVIFLLGLLPFLGLLSFAFGHGKNKAVPAYDEKR